MKREFLFTVLFVAPVWLPAQYVVVSPLVEKTINSYQYGASVSLEVQSQWRFGVFYQATLSTREKGGPYDPFWGMTVSVPVMKEERMTFYTNVRLGIVNKYFFVVCPAVATEFKIMKRMHINVGMSIRKGYLSAQTALNIKL